MLPGCPHYTIFYTIKTATRERLSNRGWIGKFRNFTKSKKLSSVSTLIYSSFSRDIPFMQFSSFLSLERVSPLPFLSLQKERVSLPVSKKLRNLRRTLERSIVADLQSANFSTIQYDPAPSQVSNFFPPKPRTDGSSSFSLV